MSSLMAPFPSGNVAKNFQKPAENCSLSVRKKFGNYNFVKTNVFPQKVPLASRVQFWQNCRNLSAEVRNDLVWGPKNVTFLNTIRNSFSFNLFCRHKECSFDNAAEQILPKMKIIRSKNKKTKKFSTLCHETFCSNVAWTRKYRSDNHDEVFQQEVKRLFFQSPNWYNNSKFLKERIFIKSFLWISWMRFSTKLTKLFFLKVRKYLGQIPQTRKKYLRQKENFSTSECFFGHVDC